MPAVPIVAVIGVTASGKSALALSLAERYGGEIVSTDSLQVYRYLDIGTAKATASEQVRVPHHLIDVVNPDEAYSAGRYVEDAQCVLDDLARRGRVPILCGGTGLYFKALLRGLAPVPPLPEAVRREVAAWVARKGPEAAHAELVRVDAETARRIHPHDTARVARALEVVRGTGRPLSAYQQGQPFGLPAEQVLYLGIAWERPALRERIARRVDEMFRGGWVDEMRGVLARGYDPACKPLQGIGYREIGEFLRGERNDASLRPDIVRRTRQYAKRQETWFRHQLAPSDAPHAARVVWAPPGDEATLLRAAEAHLA